MKRDTKESAPNINAANFIAVVVEPIPIAGLVVLHTPDNPLLPLHQRGSERPPAAQNIAQLLRAGSIVEIRIRRPACVNIDVAVVVVEDEGRVKVRPVAHFARPKLIHDTCHGPPDELESDEATDKEDPIERTNEITSEGTSERTNERTNGESAIRFDNSRGQGSEPSFMLLTEKPIFSKQLIRNQNP